MKLKYSCFYECFAGLQGEAEEQTHSFLTLELDWGLVVSLMLRPPYPLVISLVLISWDVRWALTARLDLLEKRKMFCPCQNSNREPSSPFLVTTPTELFLLLSSYTVPVCWRILDVSGLADSFVRWNVYCEWVSHSNNQRTASIPW